MKRFSIAFMLIVLSSAIAFAQGVTGSLSGTVSGPDGVLPGATVTATDSSTKRELTVTSGGDGSFSFTQLEAGTYTIRFTAAGFKALVANSQKIDVGRQATLDVALEVGDVTAEVVVTAGADVVTSTTAQVSNTVSPQQIMSLPLLVRNPLALTTLQAGVSSNSAQNTTINGMRTTFTNITRDGINIQDTFIRSNATDFAPGRPSVDDTGEFTITTTNQEADQGYGGAQIRLVTPRGTRDFHGALFAYNRNSDFAANSFFNNRAGEYVATDTNVLNGRNKVGDDRTPRPFRNRNQYGGKASWRFPVPGLGEGTPALFWDKAFFFFAYEGIKDPVTAVATRVILTPTARAGQFRYQRTNATDVTPFCPSQAVGSICTIPNVLAYAQGFFPTAGISGTTPAVVVNQVLAPMPTESNFAGGDTVTIGGVPTNLNTAGFRLLRGSNQTRDQYSTRIDVDIDDRNTLTGIYNYNKEVNLRPDVDGSGYSVTPDVSQFSDNRQFTMAFRRVFSNNFINDFRGGIFTSVVPFDRTSPSPDFILGVPLVTSPLQFLDQGRNTKAFNFQSNADWVLGDHTLRFGGQAQIFRVNAYNDAAILPVVNVGSGTNSTFTSTAGTSTTPTGIGGLSAGGIGALNGLVSLLGGNFNQVTQSFNNESIDAGFVRGATALTPFRYENHAFYVADRWTAAKGLTLNLGVRYELFPALRLNNGLALEPVITNDDNVLPDLFNPAGIYNPIGGNAGRRNAYYKTDYNNFAPNLGVAWAPSFEGGPMGWLFGQNKTVIRAGYSHIYGNDSIVTSINNAAAGNAGLGRTAVTQGGLNGRLAAGSPPQVPAPTISAFPRTYLQNNGPGLGNFFGTVFAIDPKLKTPKVEQYSFGVQRELFGGMAFEIRYVGSRSTNLGRGIDLGQIDIVNNGFLADFRRAQANARANGGNAFCAPGPGCVALQIFQNGGVGSPGRLAVGGPTGLTASTFNAALASGAVADLALSFINSTGPAATPGLNNLNNQPCTGTTAAYSGCSASLVPFVKFLPNAGSGVIDLFLNDGRYRYDSLQTEIRKRFSAGLYFQVNYTYSKNLTNAVGTSQALFEPYLDNNNQALDYQRADFDTTHVFNFNGIYQLPFGQGKKFLNYSGFADKILGGWEISGLGNWQSGAPITFVDTRGTLNRAGRSARQTPVSTLDNQGIQNLVGIFEANGNIYFLNPSVINTTGRASEAPTLLLPSGAPFSGQVFFNTLPGQTGNIGRALIDGPRFFNINMALLKSIKFTESMRIQLRMEAFNVLNNVNFVQNTQFANINATNFGQITTAFGPRELQFAARFEF